MAKASKKAIRQPSFEKAISVVKRFRDRAMVSEAEVAGEVAEVLLSAGLRVLEREQSRGMIGDLLVSRQELGRERRYSVEIVLEINNSKIREHFFRFQNHIRQSKQPFRDFDEYWLVGYRYANEPMRKRPENDRHFRVFDLKELRALFAPPKAPKKGGRARTKIGKAVEANGDQILLAVASLTLQIEEKLTVLRGELPNSPESIAKRDLAISYFERMKAELQNIREMVIQFRKNEVSEAKAVQSVKTFSEGVRLWWNKSHDKICDKAYDMGMFATAVTICSIAGASGNVGVALSAAMVGGKPVADVVKALAKKFLPS
jgi:hypothetical protein